MDPTRGTILRAHHDSHEIVLQGSKLFDFSNVKTAPFELSMRHLQARWKYRTVPCNFHYRGR